MNSNIKKQLESYINPNDLLEDEVKFELSIRNLPISVEAPQNRSELRKAQLEEILKPKTSFAKTYIGQEFRTIQTKTKDLKHLLETYPDSRYISRLRHCRLRAIRAHPSTREQQRLKEELISDIEILLERYGKPSDRRENLPSAGPQLNYSQDFSRSFEEKMNQFTFSLSDMSTAKKKKPETPTTSNLPRTEKRLSFHPLPQDLEEGLLDEAIGGTEPTEKETNIPPTNLEPNLNFPFYSKEVLLPRRKDHLERDRNAQVPQAIQLNRAWEEPSIRQERTNIPNTQNLTQQNEATTFDFGPQMEGIKNDISQFIQQTLASQMTEMMAKMLPLFEQQRVETPSPVETFYNVPLRPPPQLARSPSPINRPPPIPPRPFQPQTPFRENDYSRNYRVSMGETNQWQVPISKWRVQFSGDSKGPTVTQFINRVEILANSNRVSEQDLLNQALFFLEKDHRLKNGTILSVISLMIGLHSNTSFGYDLNSLTKTL
ncbi:uncharacterized protein LOC129749105 [Uranotaenia lowii]|uniref:uncharacterized protein LOC129749105 n=1 Tax=Uranotaenia lowii TaxID=190385 RepID=UPI002479289F|nr:uncharacterized protein LOC129749105 [Uranotaenia lowii]